MDLDTALEEIKEYTAQFKTEGDLAVDVNDFSPTETLESDSDLGESEEEKREIEQETAVAAARSNRNILKAQAPPGMELVNEQDADSMRKGLPTRSAMYSNPPAGPITWPAPEALPENVNVNNLILTHTELGEHAEVAPFARWCNETPQHIIAAS